MNYYIAYGSNLYSEQFYQRCPDSVFVASGVLKDYTLAFCGINGNAFLTVKKQAGGSVPVAVYCQTAHCGRCKLHFVFGEFTSPIVPYRNLPQAPDGMTADCCSLV